MIEWKEIELGDYCSKIGSGATPKGGSNSYKNEGISLIRSQNVLDFRFAKNGLAFIDDEQANALKNVTVNENDVLLNITGDSVARVCKVPLNVLPARVNQHVAIIRTQNEKLDSDFLLYNLLSQKEELLSQSEIGATRRAITKGMIEKFIISLPPLPEQRAIASVLSSLDDKIDLLHRQNKTLEQMAETLFRQWFVEEASEEWEEVKLGDMIDIKHGYAFKGKFITNERTNLKLVTPGNVSIGGGFKSEKFKYYSDSNFPIEYILKPGDLIVTMTDLSINSDTLGFPAIIPNSHDNEIFLHNQRIGKVEFSEFTGKMYLYNLLKSKDYNFYILGSASGTSIRHTSPNTIKEYCFFIPPTDKIKEFEQIVGDIFRKQDKNLKRIRTLEKLRDTLLPKLMSGEVRVNLEN